VLKLCTMDKLVAAAPRLLDMAETLKVDFLSNFVIKKTFFNHFCGGANDAEVEKTILTLEKQGIQPILDLAFEADLETAEDTGPGESVAPDGKVVQMTRSTINLASKAKDGFVALKITAFASPAVLGRISNLLNAINHLFEETSGPEMSTVGHEDLVRLVSRLSGLEATKASETVDRIFGKALKERGSVDWNDFSRLLSPIDKGNRPLLQMIKANDEDFPLPTADDYKELDSAWEICSDLIRLAQEKHVTITVDAEWSFSQPAIDLVVMHLMREFNKFGDPDGPLVFNTIQMYLKDSLPRLKLDLARAERENFTYGVKLVRGAYMFMERKRAAELEIPDPIHKSIEATHKAYNDGVELLLNKAAKAEAQKNGNEVNFILASHNPDSIVSCMQKMEAMGMDKGTRVVRFAQLQGMKDYLTKTLGRLGYRAYKYVPYGMFLSRIG
jgi:proline dehydrogenase